MVRGDPAQVLCERSADADLLVVGSRGHGGFARLVLGLVGTACAHHSKCPVAIIPKAGQADRMPITREWHLRPVLAERAGRYDTSRPHRELQQNPPAGSAHPPEGTDQHARSAP